MISIPADAANRIGSRTNFNYPDLLKNLSNPATAKKNIWNSNGLQRDIACPIFVASRQDFLRMLKCPYDEALLNLYPLRLWASGVSTLYAGRRIRFQLFLCSPFVNIFQLETPG